MTNNLNQKNPIFLRYQERVSELLQQWLPDASTLPEHLHEAMHYSVMGGGKRLRPLLVYITGNCLGAHISELDIPAAAVELVHCYSLVHDDLPAMDDDDLRRGKPTCHKTFDEATAILVGDALQSLAFELLASERPSPDKNLQLEMIKVLAHASGSAGMAGGQAMDLNLQTETQHPTLEQIETLHKLKTGALIRASVRLGALAANCHDSETLNDLDLFASYIGLAFQIQDDLLDIEGNTATLGKPAGSDQAQQKATYPAVSNLAQAKQRVDELQRDALMALTRLSQDTSTLAELSYQLTHRDA